jgi:hypothetical protein
MARNDYRHSQQWILHIHPDEGETWPLAEIPGSDGRQFQPTGITFSASAGTGPSIALRGLRLRQDGSVGKLPARGYRPLPDWAAKILDAARDEHGLGDEYLREQGVRI